MWDHHPVAQELLEARVKRGWQPTASAVRGDQQVLGYAACLVGNKVSEES